MSLPLFATLCVLLIGSASAAEVCCGGNLGCFNNTGVFYSFLNRPILLLPDCDCDLISRFRLHLNTRANPTATQVLDPYDLTTVAGSHFSVERETKILIHGFTDNFAWPWWTDMIAALLGDGDFNIIRLDWSAGNVPPYMKATANTRIAGAYVAKFVNTLKEQLAYSPSNIHIIGHSLGAHISGYAGERVDKIARISGIDPAGLYFTNMDPVVRLDPSDAVKVDTLIADGEPILSLGFGSLQAMGHLNFYPNGGNKQPGCSALITVTGGPTSFNDSSFDWLAGGVQTFYQTIGCNHWRALSLYTETIGQQKCLAKAFQCESYAKYLGGECFSSLNGGSSNLGYQADISLAEPNRVKNFYLSTTERPPFCVQSLRLKLNILAKTPSNDVRRERGTIFVTLHGALGASARVPLTAEDVELNPGAQLSFLFTIPHDVGLVRDVAIYWEANYSILTPGDWLRKHYLQIDGNLELEHQNGQVILLRPLVRKIEEKKEVFTTATQA
ncbi:Pancreatic triacylglycerol lipase [Hypsibius exemplaris]|uniref:Pancreatic triacylglycerol lipase n=1 Tax=Hypsibius exemplaris TaxID=2072580 RepID=A0A1W0WWW7_HYPEX|nr:Pancreatic triacylglycerol lipase [Hypsibius exemplaris]